MTDIEIDEEIIRLIQRSGRRLAVICAEHRDGEIYAKAYGDGDLAGKFSLTHASAAKDVVCTLTKLRIAGDRRDWDECDRLEGQ